MAPSQQLDGILPRVVTGVRVFATGISEPNDK
jgi:hypothetical protein